MMILRLKKMRFFCYSFFCVKREREREWGTGDFGKLLCLVMLRR